MAVELHQLDVLEEGMRQAAALERTHAVARAQEETVTLARLLRGKQEGLSARNRRTGDEGERGDARFGETALRGSSRGGERSGRLQEKVDKTRAEASEIERERRRERLAGLRSGSRGAIQVGRTAHQSGARSSGRSASFGRFYGFGCRRESSLAEQHEERIKSRMASSSSRVEDERGDDESF